MAENAVRQVMELYPRIYFACHTRHVRDPQTRRLLSAHQASILDHLDEHEPLALLDLAHHMGVTASTMSLNIERLVRRGLRFARACRRRWPAAQAAHHARRVCAFAKPSRFSIPRECALCWPGFRRLSAKRESMAWHSWRVPGANKWKRRVNERRRDVGGCLLSGTNVISFLRGVA